MCLPTTRRPDSAWCRRWRGSRLPALPIGQSKAAQGRRSGCGGGRRRPQALGGRRVSPPSRNSPAIGNTCSTRRYSPRPPIRSGAAPRMIGEAGELLGIGSLQVQQVRESGTPEPLNMIVPIDILKPILDDLLTSAGQSAAASVARAQCHRDRRQGRGRAGRPMADRRAAPICAPATSCWRLPADEVERARRLFPQGVVAGQGRRRGAADDLPRWPHLRGARDLRRPQPISQGSEPALAQSAVWHQDQNKVLGTPAGLRVRLEVRVPGD